MVRAAALMLVVAQAPTGPALLVLEGANTSTIYVQFSTFSRCEQERERVEKSVRRMIEELKARRITVIAGTERKARCIPG